MGDGGHTKERAEGSIRAEFRARREQEKLDRIRSITLTVARADAATREVAAERARAEAAMRAPTIARVRADLLRARQAEAEARAKASARADAAVRAKQTEAATRAKAKASARADEAAREAVRANQALAIRRDGVRARIAEAFESDYLNADDAYALDADRDLITSGEYRQMKTAFVREWAERALHEHLDDDQAAAVSVTRGNVRVVARAGSGKTRTLVTRAIFLQRHCRVPAGELLLLAFNRKAAAEMQDRLRKAVDTDLPHVMTFHALAHALVHPGEDMVFDDRAGGQLGFSREVQEVIDGLIRSPDHRDQIRDLMLAHFREDWERIVDGHFELTIDDFLAYRRALPRESLNGDFVKSFGERQIANALFEHGIDYKYERNRRWNGVNYRPDFTIAAADGGIAIEYFGLKGDPDYDDSSDAKRAYWANQEGWTLLAYSPSDLTHRGTAAFVERLLADLGELGVHALQRSEEEIWQLVRTRAIDRFTGAMTTFLVCCRRRNLDLPALQSKIRAHRPSSTAEGIFVEVGEALFAGYLERLAAHGIEDFDGLMWRAVATVCGGSTSFVRDRGTERGDLSRLRFLMIDEFQDFSESFYRLIEGIRSANPALTLFCVGDDWQAINGFAGADLKYFREFEALIPDSRTQQLSVNYRSAARVVKTGNALMHGRGLPARAAKEEAGSAWLCRIDAFEPSGFERERFGEDDVTPAVLRLVRWFLDAGDDVAMLSRRNGLSWHVNYADSRHTQIDPLVRFVEHIRSFLPEDDRRRVTISTVHRYKGLEQSAVIVLDAVQGSYPLVHPSWIFQRLFGETIARIEDEERRLFYVAITRAGRSLALLTDSRLRSPYIADIERHERLIALDWNSLPAVPTGDSPKVEVRVFDGFQIRDRLKDLGYRWQAGQRYWWKTTFADVFSFEAVLHQDWARAPYRIAVYTERGEVLHERSAMPTEVPL